MPGLLKKKVSNPANRYLGRNKESKQISEALWGPQQYSLLFVEGSAGVGKTSLIKRVLETDQQKNSFKLYGKFQNHRGNAPYSAFNQAFASWGQQILILPDEEFDALRENVTSSLQTYITVITAVFPDLEVFFSRKHIVPPSSQPDSHQIKARFYYFLVKFLTSITKRNYEVVIFLDDLQWADKASLELLEELNKTQITGLKFVVTYRQSDNLNYNLSDRIETFRTSKSCQVIKLKPFPRSIVGRMVPPEWKFSKENIAAFTNYLWIETEGNPFKIKQIIKTVETDGIIFLRPENPDFWERLPKIGGGKDSVNFILEQIRALSFHHQKLIGTASCLGFYFNLKVLKNILGSFDRSSREALEHLSKRGFLMKKKHVYVFAHDNVFSAANSLLSKFEKCDLHKKAAFYFLKNCDNYEQVDFFKAVNHLNMANEMAGTRKVYSAEIILLNIQAARLAVKNSAFETALGYISNAEKLFRNNAEAIEIEDPTLIEIFETKKIDNKGITFHLLYGYAEIMFLLQKFEVALSYAQQVLDFESTRHQRVKAMLIKIRICSALIYQKNTTHILEKGLSNFEQTLGEFGLGFPPSFEKMVEENRKNLHLLQEKVAAYTEQTDFTGLLNNDSEYQDLLKLIATSLTSLYYHDIKKHLNLTLKALLLIIDKGHTPVSPVLFSASFVISHFSPESRNLAYLLGRLSLKMIESYPFKKYSHIIYYVGTLNFVAWNNHYKFCIKKLQESVVKAYEAGDPHYAAFCSTNIRLLDCYRGKNLLKHLKAIEKLDKNNQVFFISSSDTDLTHYLAGTKPGFEKGEFSFSKELTEQSQKNLNSRYHLYLALQKLHFISGNYKAAQEAGEVCESLPQVYKGFQTELEHFLFYSLSILQKSNEKPVNLEETLLKVKPKLEEFRRLSKFKSGNYLHKVYLIQAEIEKCKGNFEEATLFYDQAIEQAKKSKFHHHAAIAAELAFKYYMEKNRIRLAKHYFKICLKYYKLWGATAKMRQLHLNYESLYKPKKHRKKRSLLTGHYDTIKRIIRRNVPSGNIHIEELGQYLLDLLVTDTKAKKGGLFILKENIWEIQAEKALNVQIHQTLKDLEDRLPVSVINYSSKKGEKLVLQEVLREPLFARDQYLRAQEPKNITLFPVKQSGQTIGVFYLEDCKINSEAEKDLFLVKLELACTTFANAVYYENNNNLNKKLKLQERNRIEAIIESQEKERKRIAEELHDSLGQILALTKINLSRLNPTDTTTEKELLLRNISDLIDDSCEEVRSISHNLMPPTLDAQNISDILENLIGKNRILSNIEYNFFAENFKNEPSTACKFTLYRVLQEILQNIIKHASATKVDISLTETSGLIHLLVEDNGKGFDTNITGFGLGLKNIYSRVKLLNGYLDIDSSINNGTTFNVSIPQTN